ncbi:hypothetical protein [Candidatus Spongiisocius sp.]|uniref:hypothetical protein n=1 Tax=Candidatus Spongiisocius sp. TaxID=3101273 RepID=UPI003B58EB46
MTRSAAPDRQRLRPAGSLRSPSVHVVRVGSTIDRCLICWPDHPEVSTGRFTAVAGGLSHWCAIRIDGSITCWGDNDRGQAIPPRTFPR